MQSKPCQDEGQVPEDIKVATADMLKESKREATQEGLAALSYQKSSRKEETQSSGSAATDITVTKMENWPEMLNDIFGYSVSSTYNKTEMIER